MWKKEMKNGKAESERVRAWIQSLI